MFGTYKCFHPACEKKVATDMFGCREHWYALSWNMRARIDKAYQGWKSKRSMFHVGELRAAQKSAIDFVTNRAAQIAKLAPDDLARKLPSTHLNCVGRSDAGLALGQANTETTQP